MILAAGKSDFEIILYIAAAVWGVISWVRQKKGETDTPVEPGPPRQPPAPRPVQQGESEQERMRRFLEALGVPQGQQPSPPIIPAPVQRPKPAPAPVQQRPAPQPRPVQRPQTTQTVRQPAPRPVVAEPEEMQLAGRLEEPATAVENVGKAFDAMAGGVVVSQIEVPTQNTEVTARGVVDGTQHTSPTAVSGKAIHAMLRSPDSLRTALVIREILGPPRGEMI